MGGFVMAGRDVVGVDAEQALADAFEVGDARLLGHFAPSGPLDRRIVGLDVPTRLQPLPESGMVDQQQRSPIRMHHESRRREVPRLELRPWPHGTVRVECAERHPMRHGILRRHISANERSEIRGSGHEFSVLNCQRSTVNGQRRSS